MNDLKPRLVPLAEELWAFEHDLYLPGRVHFRGRSCVARLDDGSLWVHSPNPLDDALAAELAALGPVRHLVAPNKLHHLHLADAMARYGDARVWVAPGLADKRDDLAAHGELRALGDGAPSDWAGQIDQLVIGGAPWVNEVVFVHRRSGALLVTDLVFNVHEVEGWISPLVFRMTGAYRKLAQSRLFRSQVKDRRAFARSGEALLQLDFDKVVMAHGEPLLAPDAEGRTPRERLETALGWMLQRDAVAA